MSDILKSIKVFGSDKERDTELKKFKSVVIEDGAVLRIASACGVSNIMRSDGSVDIGAYGLKNRVEVPYVLETSESVLDATDARVLIEELYQAMNRQGESSRGATVAACVNGVRIAILGRFRNLRESSEFAKIKKSEVVAELKATSHHNTALTAKIAELEAALKNLPPVEQAKIKAALEAVK